MTGQLLCSVCDAKYQTRIHSLTEPIDVFTEWLDETADAQAKLTKRLARDGSAVPVQRTKVVVNEDEDVTAGYHDDDEAEEDEY